MQQNVINILCFSFVSSCFLQFCRISDGLETTETKEMLDSHNLRWETKVKGSHRSLHIKRCQDRSVGNKKMASFRKNFQHFDHHWSDLREFIFGLCLKLIFINSEFKKTLLIIQLSCNLYMWLNKGRELINLPNVMELGRQGQNSYFSFKCCFCCLL